MNKIVAFMLIFFFISGSVIAVLNPVSATALVENSWNTKTPLTYTRSGLGVVAVDDKIYAIGGDANYEAVGINERYDPKTNIWTTLEPMPTPRRNFAIAAYQCKIYCIDGYSTNGSRHNIFDSLNEVYDPVTNSWSTKAPFPDSYSSIYGENYQAYVVDGKNFVKHHDILYLYDQNADLWITKTSAPSGGIIGFSFAMNNMILDYFIYMYS
jgi:N-acetylneuraminic acid mutarotase